MKEYCVVAIYWGNITFSEYDTLEECLTDIEANTDMSYKVLFVGRNILADTPEAMRRHAQQEATP